ncbi:MAG: replication-associated recombination protein A [Planctomycetota bacterium]|nr:replication-associated recombination protein A [Planctomycetota bacterium]
MTDLFGSEPVEEDPFESVQDAPLADRMRPTTMDEYVGQTHLVGPGKILDPTRPGWNQQSLILWGPPGVGKTTLARLIAAQSELRYVAYSAVLSGIKEIRQVMAEAKDWRRAHGVGTLVFVDEIHRFNKAQQDAFLPFVERGDILLIGATTENPSFEVNGALLSRSRALLLQPLTPEDLHGLLQRALTHERGLSGSDLDVEDGLLNAMAQAADGDARRALTLLETAAALAGGGEGEGPTALTPDHLKEALQGKALHYDKSGEEHYNLISALHKSLRNSDVNATIYWLTRMMAAGEDGMYLARRMIRFASEDVGLADPFALRIALDAADAFHMLGYPEGKLALVQAAAYLAQAPKSNALYAALGAAESDVQSTSADPVPFHLRNASTGLMKEAGYGKGYRYAHDDPAARDEMTCLPENLQGRTYLKLPPKR